MKEFLQNESGVIIFLGFKWMFELFLDFSLPETDAQLLGLYGICLFHPLSLGGILNFVSNSVYSLDWLYT